MKENTEGIIKKYISEKTEIPVEELDSDTMLFEYGITSLQFMEYVVEIENLFDIHLTDRDLNDIYTIRDFVKRIEKVKE